MALNESYADGGMASEEYRREDDRLESETAKIIAERFLKKDEILLTIDEDERLKQVIFPHKV